MRLSPAALRGYRGPAVLPRYDRSDLRPGILHLGVGSFHRAHQAVAIDDLLSEAPEWGIRGVSLRRPDIAGALSPQEGLYTLGVRRAEGLKTRIIGAVLSVDTGVAAAIAALAQPDIRLVTITMTEKGYAADGPLAQVLSAGLARRAAAQAGPVTVLSCDNLADNGARTGALIRQTAAQELHGWLDDQLTTPSCMVDRITPATTQVDRQKIAAITGLDDAAPVMTEPFSQWVIEDRFAAARPPFEVASVQLVEDVAPFEETKLRLLNGAHTTLALLGPMLGHREVAQAVADRDLAALLAHTAQTDVFPTLPLPRTDLDAYWRALMIRFANPAMHHRLAQIAADSSEKVPVRLVPPWLARARVGAAAPGLCLAVAAWLVAVRLADTPLSDPRDAELRRMACGTPDRMAARLTQAGAPLALLGDHSDLCRDLVQAVVRIERDGARAAIRAVLTQAEAPGPG